MIQHYIEAARRVLAGVFDWSVQLLTQLAWPLAFCFGLVVLAIMLSLYLPKNGERAEASIGDLWQRWQRPLARLCGYALVVIFLMVAWHSLRLTRVLAVQDIRWRDAAEVTTNPVPDAPPVYQYGPAVARLGEKAYTRTLTLPPYFLDQIGTDGVGVLAPYLTDPSAENVVRLRDTFRRSGRNVVFTRESTLMTEDPIPFADSQIDVKFQRLPGSAYDVLFAGHYVFQNTSDSADTIHFLFTLPQAGAVRDLSIKVGNENINGPTTSATGNADTYEWRGEMKPQERREAVVTYRVVGTRTWRYDLGSQRRQVQKFRLTANNAGLVGFLRGSLQPTAQTSSALNWEMANVVTAQQIALSFAANDMGNKLYFQALSALPASLLLFLIGTLIFGYWLGSPPTSVQLLGGLVLFAFGLGSSTVFTIYFGAVGGVILGPVIGALLAVIFLGRYSLLFSLPIALLPAAFLSEKNSGLLVFLLAVLTLLAVYLAMRYKTAAPA